MATVAMDLNVVWLFSEYAAVRPAVDRVGRVFNGRSGGVQAVETRACREQLDWDGSRP